METIVEVGGAALYTIVHPYPGRETVILLHGGPCVPDGLGPVAARLSEDHQVIQFHQRGTALSPCRDSRFRIDSYVSDLDAVARQFNLDSFHLFGHSWGGCYAQIYAERFPERVRSLFLCCSAGGTGRHWASTMLDVASWVRKRSTRADWLRMEIGALLGLAGSTRGFQLQFRLMGRAFNRGFPTEHAVPFRVDLVRHRPVVPTVSAILKHPVLRHVPDPGFPVTILYGSDDAITGSQRYVKERYPTATHVTVPDSGHFPWLHNPGPFYQALAAHYSG